MIRRAVCLAFALSVAAGVAAAATPDPAVLDGAIKAGRAVADVNGLTLVLTNGKRLSLANLTAGCPTGDKQLDDANCKHYLLAADLPAQHAFVVQVLYYEGAGQLLIDDGSGRQTDIDGMPVFSPDGSRFFINDDDELNDHDNNLEIWRRDGDSASLEWAHPYQQVYVEAPVLKGLYHARVTDWSQPETINLAFSYISLNWKGQLTHQADGWHLSADWPH